MSTATRPKPHLDPEYCKGCLRCIDACAKDCITQGEAINPATGMVPVHLDLTDCNGCGLCIQACPEPYGLRPQAGPAGHEEAFELQDPKHLFGAKGNGHPAPETQPAMQVALPDQAPLVMKGTYASAIGAVLAGCRHVFGYPITPSTEGAELMAKLLPKLDGSFVQAVSEVAAVNMMYGFGGAGLPSMTFTSGPGFSLMLEGISYMIGAEVPGVFVNITRGGPGLGNIAPEQADIKLACRGLGHGNTHAIVLAPSTPQEMLDLTMEAFSLSFRYRNPVVLLGDGSSAGPTCPPPSTPPTSPSSWPVPAATAHRRRPSCSRGPASSPASTPPTSPATGPRAGVAPPTRMSISPKARC
jgi:TPP-dependent indolepyruvate ferredoxin oxidoreductase alpha subunit